MSSQSDKPSPVRVHIVVAAGEDEGSATDDVHYCGRCKLVFSNIKDYLEHKVSHDRCKVTYSRSASHRRMFLPNIVQKNAGGNQESQKGDSQSEPGSEGKQIRRRGKRKVAEESVITPKFSYRCSVCNLDFNRVAALKRHLEYDHRIEGSILTEVTEHDSDEGDELDEEEETDDYQPSIKRPRKRKSEAVSEKPHVCEICGNKFKEGNVLKTHLLTHTNQRDFKCTVDGCNYAFKTKGSLTRHLRRHTGEKPYSCSLCGRSFSESGALTRHMKSRTPCKNKDDTDLPRYGKRWGFDNTPQLAGGPLPQGTPAAPVDAHVTPAAPKEPVDTQVTPVSPVEPVDAQVTPANPVEIQDEGDPGSVEGNEDEESHSQEEEESMNLNVRKGGPGEQDLEIDESSEVRTVGLGLLPENTCRVCQLGCDGVDDLKSHLRLHLADTSSRCQLCHFVADSQEQLVQHNQSIHMEKSALGPLVINVGDGVEDGAADPDKALRDAKVAVQQLLEVSDGTEFMGSQGGDKSDYTCPICQKSLRGQSHFNQHIKSHTGERPFKCTKCEKTFTCKDTLTKHVSVHNEDRQFKCGECGKLFKRISHVREHLKIHTGDRPFQCGVCEKTFKTANAAKVHSRTHSDIMPYECPHCHKFFREKGSLQRHARMHTGEKPFKCKHCGRAFAEHGTLSRHMKAKVPCTYFPQVGNKSQEGYPTVLAEFSSVVADTQQYIVPETSSDSAEEQSLPTELVVVQASDIPVDALQNVEIISSGAGDREAIVLNNSEDGSQYVVLGQPGDDLRVLDPHTGHTVATLPAHMVSMTSPTGNIEALIMNPSSDLEGVVLNSEHHYPQEIELHANNSPTFTNTCTQPSSGAQDSHHMAALTLDEVESRVHTVSVNEDTSGVHTVSVNEDTSGVHTVSVNEDTSGVHTVSVNEDTSSVHTVSVNVGDSGVHTFSVNEDSSGVHTVTVNEDASGVHTVTVNEDGSGVQTVNEVESDVNALTVNEDGIGVHTVTMSTDVSGIQTVTINKYDDVNVLTTDENGSDVHTLTVNESDSGVRTVTENEDGNNVNTLTVNEDDNGVHRVIVNDDGSGVNAILVNQDGGGVQAFTINDSDSGVQDITINEDGCGIQTVLIHKNGSCLEGVEIGEDGTGIQTDDACVETIIMMTDDQMVVTETIDQAMMETTATNEEDSPPTVGSQTPT